MKICISCKTEKDLTEFTKNRSKKDGYNTSCRECKRKHQQAWYAKSSTAQKKRVFERNKRIRGTLLKQLFDYLTEHPCVKCGEADPVVLEFDHLRDKTTEISNLIARSYSWERVLEEIAKCQVLCANCHRRKTAIDQNWGIYKLQMGVKLDSELGAS
jgi:hypothetical protein